METISPDGESTAGLCRPIEPDGDGFMALQQACNLESSQELLDPVKTHRRGRQLANE
jgi:hypothetical protein